MVRSSTAKAYVSTVPAMLATSSATSRTGPSELFKKTYTSTAVHISAGRLDDVIHCTWNVSEHRSPVSTFGLITCTSGVPVGAIVGSGPIVIWSWLVSPEKRCPLLLCPKCEPEEGSFPETAEVISSSVLGQTRKEWNHARTIAVQRGRFRAAPQLGESARFSKEHDEGEQRDCLDQAEQKGN